MNNTFILLILVFLTNIIYGQGEPIKGRYGKNDIRIRAGNGSIEEGRLRKFDFGKSGLSNIAVIYWSDNNYGFQKIGITIFENKKQQDNLGVDVIIRNREILSEKLDSIRKFDFTLIETPNSIEQLFERKRIVSKIKLLDQSEKFIESLKLDGYDGLFIIYEDQFQDLITGAKGWFPSKGLFKFYKKELVYYGLYSTLIDLSSSKTVKNIGYKQLSADYSQISFKEVKSLTTDQIETLKNELVRRFENNISEILRVHKIDYR